MDKRDLVAQLQAQIRDLAHTAVSASSAAASEARNGATSKEKRTDARVALEYAGLARGQRQRAQRAFEQLSALESFDPTPAAHNGRAEVGSVIEIEDDDTGEGRTLFIAPVGAGIILTGPGGDGILSVVTPNSPIGRAVLGCQVGDGIDVTVKNTVRAWTITWIA